MFPETSVNVRQFLLGPGEGGKIQVRVMGPDLDEIRKLAGQVVDVMEADPGAKGVFTDTHEKIKVIRPILAEAQARRAGIDRHDVAGVLESSFSGSQTGLYREGEELLPIIARSPEEERMNVDALRGLQIWSPAAQRMIPLTQIVTGFETRWDEANVWRRDRTPMIKVHCDPRYELPSELFARLKPAIERELGVDVSAVLGKEFGSEEDPWAGLKETTLKIVWGKKMPLKDRPGYSMSWGGQMEDSAQANASLNAMLPVFVGAMVLIVIFLFNSLRKPLVIWLTVPLSIIGVTLGLLSTSQPFGFMAMLGLLSLSGMLIKNAIVLVDEINANEAGGKSMYDAIVLAGVSRMRPVSMAALTTILGMVPLLGDAFFISMAVTIMFGLGVATILTLIIVPVFYAIAFKVKSPARA
jgi:multidrug efflux pump subunit AcrB